MSIFFEVEFTNIIGNHCEAITGSFAAVQEYAQKESVANGCQYTIRKLSEAEFREIAGNPGCYRNTSLRTL